MATDGLAAGLRRHLRLGDAWGRLPHPLRSAVLPALVLVCLLEIAKFAGILGWLDARTFTLLSLLREPMPLSASAAMGMPRLVLIDDALFDAHFERRSPLDRDRLAALIEAVAAQKPRILAIDLDLGPDRSLDGRMAWRRIDEVICEHARPDLVVGASPPPSCLERAAMLPTDGTNCGVRFVLLVPFQSGVPAVEDANAEWLRAIEKALGPCVRFAIADIEEQGGRAVYFRRRLPTLGVVAHEMANGTRVCSTRHDPHPAPLNAAFLDATEFEKRMQPEGHGPLLISPRADRNGAAIVWPDPVRPLVGEAVFIGGTWGDDDLRGTAVADNVSGVAIHAAIFWTLSHPVASFGHAWAFVLDVVIGIVTGWAFGFFWGRFNAEVRFRASHPGAPSWRDRPDSLDASYAALVGWGACAWAALALALAVIFGLSGSLLSLGLWLNPGPMILGLFLHTLIASREEDHGSGETVRGAVWRYLGLGLRILRWAIVAMLVAIGIGVAFGLICQTSTGIALCWAH